MATNREIYWVVQPADPSEKNADCVAAYKAGLKRVEDIEKRVVVDTPDPWLNAAVGASSSVIDGVFRNGMFTHAGMRWGTPLLGWRTQFGGTVYGWHDRVLTEAKYCISRQITNSDKLEPLADEKDGLACQSTDSRLFGKGRINAYQPWHYDMQSQFFDQLVHAWRWTGEHESWQVILRPALELHLWNISAIVLIRMAMGSMKATPTRGRRMTSGITAAGRRRKRLMRTIQKNRR